MRILTLKLSTWLCGSPEEGPIAGRSMGRGSNGLLNEYDYMCCLGQFCTQLNSDVTKEDLVGKNYPSELNKLVPHLNFKAQEKIYTDMPLATQAAEINDDKSLTIKERIAKLKKLFKAYNFKIVIKP